MATYAERSIAVTRRRKLVVTTISDNSIDDNGDNFRGNQHPAATGKHVVTTISDNSIDDNGDNFRSKLALDW